MEVNRAPVRGAVLWRSVVALCLAAVTHAEVNPLRPALLPEPQMVVWRNQAVPLPEVRLEWEGVEGDALRVGELRRQVAELLRENGIKVREGAKPALRLVIEEVDAPYQADEAYRLEADEKGVRIAANTVAGLFHGVQTLRQLVVSGGEGSTVAACRIHDYPAFRIRGYMHDVGRNFIPLEQLKEHVELMSRYKYNVFHWHLTEYYGWRLESKRYPNLTADSSFQRGIGKYYTQEQFKEFLDFCWARNILVIPEFDSPGHSTAFRRGVGVDTMRDPRAKQAMVELIDELCALAPPERMPYIHVGTDEVRYPEERVGNDYLPALYEVIRRNGREVIGWWKGMSIPGDTGQIQQTWAQYSPRRGNRHIDSRSNYVNHLEALDTAVRMKFQQPCRLPHGDDIHLGGILCYWPDNRVDDPRHGFLISPVHLSTVAYAEAVWTGVLNNQSDYWAKIPPVDRYAFRVYQDFENRLAEHRDRFLTRIPFLYVKTAHIPWRLLGPVPYGAYADGEGPSPEGDAAHSWSDPVRGGAIHIRHFFSFGGHVKDAKPERGQVVWAETWIHSDRDRELAAWISFNTTSTSDHRAGGAPELGAWNPNPDCAIWINGEAVPPPVWENPGAKDKEVAFTNEIYTARPPSRIRLRAGWNRVLIRSAPHWKWVYTFTPIVWDGSIAREVEGLRYQAAPPAAADNH